jgi:methylmalonyl-CoA mutase, C-terminal domain
VSRARILLAKPGLDGHDRGLKVVAMALRDSGAEVIYLGLRVPVADIVAAAVAEDVSVIGISVLSGAHLPIAEELLTAMQAAGVEAPLVVGGTIPPRDADALARLGVAAVFAVGTPLPDVVEGVLELAGSQVAAR